MLATGTAERGPLHAPLYGPLHAPIPASTLPRPMLRAHARCRGEEALVPGAVAPVTTHGAWAQQCTEGNVHGVGSAPCVPCNHVALVREASLDISK